MVVIVVIIEKYSCFVVHKRKSKSLKKKPSRLCIPMPIQLEGKCSRKGTAYAFPLISGSKCHGLHGPF